MDFIFIEETQEYEIISGRFKGQRYGYDDLIEILDAQAKQKNELLAKLIAALFSGNSTLGEFETEFSRLIKTTTIQNFKLTYPGLIPKSEQTRLTNILQFQFSKLRDFMNDAISGRVSSEENFRNRAKLYLRKTYEAFEYGRERSHLLAGYVWEQRFRTATESCSPCIYYESQGIVPIGTTPPPTVECDCGGNCKCFKRFYRPNEGDRRRAERGQTDDLPRRTLF